jgi:diamine N-acetyltransferase
MIKGQNIALRMVEPSDLDCILSWENNQENWLISGTVVPFSKQMIFDYVHSSQDIYATKQLRLIIVDLVSGESLGAVDLFDFDPKNQKVGLGVLIADHKNRGKGIGKESVRLVMDYVKNSLRLHQIYCSILSDNMASKKMFVSVGFQLIGVHKDWVLGPKGWIDEELYQFVF